MNLLLKSQTFPLARWLRNRHLDGLADERHYHGSAGIFLVGREHKMPELGVGWGESHNCDYLISPFS